MRHKIWTYSFLLTTLTFSAAIANVDKKPKELSLVQPESSIEKTTGNEVSKKSEGANKEASPGSSIENITGKEIKEGSEKSPSLPVVTSSKQPPIDLQASPAKYEGPSRPVLKKSGMTNQAMFSQYCIGDASSAKTPQPNYANADVVKAAKIMSKVADVNIYFYGDLKRIYELGAPKKASEEKFEFVKNFTNKAHLFLVQTCGEFRDRAEMIQAKINWVNSMVFLGNEPQKPIDPSTENVWAQVSGHSYGSFLDMSYYVYQSRAIEAATDTYLRANLHQDAQKPAEGFTICETKYILSEYVAQGRQFDSLSSFNEGYKVFEPKCLKTDTEYYYDYRGDSNFKQYSPESNAMIWHAISIARFCASETKANGKSPKITDEICADYFSKPFLSRYSAARAGLGAWLLYSDSEKEIFQNQQTNVTVLPSFEIKNLGLMPFSMKLSDGTVAQPQVVMKDGSLGFNQMFDIGSSEAKLPLAFERLRNAVNRHTNWYASAYDDQLGHEKSMRSQAYSPFVASSYEMRASNSFTQCGYTVGCEGDGRKAWMLVFKVKKENWYNTQSLMANKPLDFDRMWFDETTFGTDSLADSERAWDRLGTALEDELATILYLHNLESSGNPVANDKFE